MSKLIRKMYQTDHFQGNTLILVIFGSLSPYLHHLERTFFTQLYPSFDCTSPLTLCINGCVFKYLAYMIVGPFVSNSGKFKRKFHKLGIENFEDFVRFDFFIENVMPCLYVQL